MTALCNCVPASHRKKKNTKQEKVVFAARADTLDDVPARSSLYSNEEVALKQYVFQCFYFVKMPSEVSFWAWLGLAWL